uniref:TF-B3 domain-containing protein n=1 Tax=Leersia perrieri TaxID=77586 RepID=A0A0D9VWG8_9ORYZ
MQICTCCSLTGMSGRKMNRGGVRSKEGGERCKEGDTIPNGFLYNFGGKIPKSVTLETSNGLTFDVQVNKNSDEVFLQSGWTSYARAHDLKRGDLLVFKYCGNSLFKTLIFNPNGCEKACSYLLKKNVTQECDLVPGCITPAGYRLTRSQKKIMNKKTKAINSENPIYGYVIIKSSIYGRPCTVEFSRKYADVYLPFEDETLVLQRRGKRWNVRCKITKKKSRRFLKGWMQFARDNNLCLGDICLFELLENKTKYVMKVHILRKK